MIQLPEVFYDKRARDGTWCRLPYPNHPRGCPNFPKCPGKHPDFKALDGLTWFAVIERFDLQTQAEEMGCRHPKWTKRQCRNLLYWQGGVKKRLMEQALRDFDPFHDVLLEIPEASGVHVFHTMDNVGIEIQMKEPWQIVKVMLVGKARTDS